MPLSLEDLLTFSSLLSLGLGPLLARLKLVQILHSLVSSF